MSNKTQLLIAISSGFLAVLLGAFGAHALKSMVPLNLLDTWKTASFYHFIHTVVVLMIALKQQTSKSHLLVVNGFFIGKILFSGSLYFYVITQIKLFAMITPIGGLVLLASWAYWFKVELTTR